MKPHLKIPLYYLLFGVTWILVSDRLASAVARGPEELALIQTAKGWTFIIVTTLLLYSCMRTHMRRLTAAQEEKVEAFHRTMRGVQHIMNAMLNRILQLRTDAQDRGALDEKLDRELDGFIRDTSNRITQLSESEEADAARLATRPRDVAMA